MPIKFNPITGKFDLVNSASGGASTTTTAPIVVYSNATIAVASVSSIDFNSYFTVTSATTGRANIGLNIGSITIPSSQISDFTEASQDNTFGYITAGSNKISVSYTDASNFLSLDVNQTNIDHNQLLNYTITQHLTIAQISITSSQISDLTETVEDIVAGELTVGSSKLTGVYNDTDGTYSIDLGTVNLDDLADVSISSAATGQVLMYSTTGWVNASIASSSVDTETVQDIVGALLTATSGVSFSYQDVTGVAAFVAVPSQIDHNQLLNYTTTQHFTIAQISITASQVSDFTEASQDVVFPFITVGSSKLSINYTDASNFFSIDVVQGNIDHNSLLNYTTTQHFLLSQISITASQVSDFTEASQDVIFPFVTVGSSKLSINYTDTANFFSIDVVQANIDHNSLLNYTTTQHFLLSQISITASQVSDFTEAAQDVTFGFLTVGSGISFNYTDASNFLQISHAQVSVGDLHQDYVLANGTRSIALNTTTSFAINLQSTGDLNLQDNGATMWAFNDTGNLFSFSTTAQIQFLTTTSKIFANSNNQITIEADTTNVGKDGADISVFGSTLRSMKPSVTEKLSHGTSSLRVFNIFMGGDIDIDGGNIISTGSVGVKVGSGSSELLGFWGATPVDRPSAYTQTFSTASKTVPANTSSAVATTAATNVAPYGYTTQAQADAIVTAINALRTDVDNAKKVVNALIDDLQEIGMTS